MENFFYSLDENSTENYPKGYFFDDILDTKMHNMSAKHRVTYWDRDSRRRIETQEIDNLTDSNGEHLPYIHYIVYRFVGEDLTLSCSFRYKDTADFANTIWTQNNTHVTNNSHVSVTVINEKRDSGDYIPVSSELNIKLLSEENVGVYTCTFCNHQIVSDSLVVEKRILVGVYEVRTMKEKIILIHREVGHLISTSFAWLYHFNGDYEDIFVFYTINGDDVYHVCPGFSTGVCSIGAGLKIGLHQFVNTEAEHFFPNVNFYPFSDQIGRIQAYFCLCGRAFGVHRITFVRKIHLNNGKVISREIVHPYMFVVLPHTSISLLRFSDDSNLNRRIEEMVMNNTTIAEIEAFMRETIDYVDSNESKVLNLANIVQAVVFFRMYLYSYCFAKCDSTRLL